MSNQKRVLTTGEVAKHCGVNFRTVLRWIDRGELKAYQLPGRGDNRVRIADFLEFLTTNQMPVPDEFAPPSNRVLIVDDEPGTANSLRRTLDRAGYDTMVAYDGFRAGSLLEVFKPAVITLDLQMPNLSGFDVISFVRTHVDRDHTKIVVISALGQDELDRAIELGADACIAKPVNIELMLEYLGRFTSDVQQHQLSQS